MVFVSNWNAANAIICNDEFTTTGHYSRLWKNAVHTKLIHNGDILRLIQVEAKHFLNWSTRTKKIQWNLCKAKAGPSFLVLALTQSLRDIGIQLLNIFFRINRIFVSWSVQLSNRSTEPIPEMPCSNSYVNLKSKAILNLFFPFQTIKGGFNYFMTLRSLDG